MQTDIGEIAVLGLADLRANKRAAGRPEDPVDLALLDEMDLAARSRRPMRTSGRSRPKATGKTARKRRSP